MAAHIKPPEFSSALLHPRYWLIWVLFGLWWLIAQFPYSVQLTLGRGLGWLSYRLSSRRRKIAARNIELCFPELTGEEREKLLRENITSTAIAVFETGMAWFWSRKRLAKLVQSIELGPVKANVDQGKGVLLLVPHFTTLEILGAFANALIPKIDMSYRPHDNPVYDFIQARQRTRHNRESTVVSRNDVRGMVRSLKSGHCMSYLPDQDLGKKQSVFAPFFNLPTATITATARIVRMADVPVVPLVCFRLKDGSGYRLETLPALENFPTGDELSDAEAINRQVEACVRKQPEQYLWVHRRFKTRPPGEKDIYGIKRRRSRKH